MKYALVSLVLVLCGTSCKVSQDPSVQYVRGRMYGQIMRSYTAVSFDPKVIEAAPASSRFNELLSRFWFQGFGISPINSLPETVDGKDVVAITKWTNRFGNDFLAGYRSGWDDAIENDIAKIGYAAGWLQADLGYDKGRDLRIGLMGLDLVTEVAVVARGLAKDQISTNPPISDTSKLTFLQNYDAGHKERSSYPSPRGDWVRVEVGLPKK